MAQAVKVMVRVRPMNGKQKQRGCNSVVEVDAKNNQINLIKEDAQQQPKSFSFDNVFAPDTLQSFIYEQSAFTLVQSVLDGYNGTIFAYGQTGCGKTHTMMGGQSQESKGIIPRTFNQIITITKNQTAKNHLVRCSFIEIYNQQIHDLLGKDIKMKMQLKESPQKGVFVKELTQIQVDSISKMEYYMDYGFKNRAVRATNMNAESSRSHSIFTIYIDSQENDDKGNEKYKASKLNLVDLAGSERISKTGTTGDGMKQATKINLSLSALGNVISALVDGKTHHIPYRDSKLTRLLQDSLGGNTKTIMIAAVSPANYNYDETLSTLRYASRAKFIKNKPKINEDPKDALLREYMDEIKRLKMMLQGKAPIVMGSTVSTLPSSGGQTIYQQKIVFKNVGNNKQNKQLQLQLLNKQNQLKNQQQQKNLLRQKLQQLQKNFNKRGPDNQDKAQLQKIKKLKQKLKLQKKKQQQFQKEKQRRQQQLLHIQKNYKNLNEEVDEMRQRFKEIKKKYTLNLVELRDLQNEHEDQKEELLDTIRYQEKQIKKYSTILNILMNNDQLQMILKNSGWDQEKRQWNVPHFTYRQRMVNFPKIHGMSKQMIEQQKQKKEIVFKQSKRQFQKRNSYEGFKVNNVIRNARQVQTHSGQNHYLRTPVTNKISGGHLSPMLSQNHDRVRNDIMLLQQNRRRKMDKLQPVHMLSNDSRKHF